jgi:hypothetical protein
MNVRAPEGLDRGQAITDDVRMALATHRREEANVAAR